MKAILLPIVLTALAAILLLPIAERSIYAQAPSGPQGGSPPPQSAPPKPALAAPSQQQAPQSGVTIAVDVPVVTLDVIAATKNGDILTGLKKENFRVLDDGAPQTITNFAPTDAPITIVMLLEFSSRGYYDWFAYQAKYWADAFFPNLQPKDWVALETFDMRTRLEVDFTQNKDEVRNAIYHLYFPGFSESNVFDALLETVDRLKDVKGKKSILVLATGVDTFSKHTLDQTMKQLRQSDVTIFAVGLDRPYNNFLESRGYQGTRMDALQGENQLRTFAQQTGGFAWFPQFDGEIPGIFRDVAAFLRHQYSISYSPANGAKDGKFHKIKVELVAPDGGPLTVVDQKGKKQKYVVYAREGYQAPKGGVGD
ncbi:MAG TPA: VWA domain-containing protein [Candidatus Dormibacteraeota bacterium]|nr:VWA domain-containing protein [Candidatus Dormibacteraeota bacterium]